MAEAICQCGHDQMRHFGSHCRVIEYTIDHEQVNCTCDNYEPAVPFVGPTPEQAAQTARLAEAWRELDDEVYDIIGVAYQSGTRIAEVIEAKYRTALSALIAAAREEQAVEIETLHRWVTG